MKRICFTIIWSLILKTTFYFDNFTADTPPGCTSWAPTASWLGIRGSIPSGWHPRTFCFPSNRSLNLYMGKGKALDSLSRASKLLAWGCVCVCMEGWGLPEVRRMTLQEVQAVCWPHHLSPKSKENHLSNYLPSSGLQHVSIREKHWCAGRREAVTPSLLSPFIL